jgi:hypothetical protein
VLLYHGGREAALQRFANIADAVYGDLLSMAAKRRVDLRRHLAEPVDLSGFRFERWARTARRDRDTNMAARYRGGVPGKRSLISVASTAS